MLKSLIITSKIHHFLSTSMYLLYTEIIAKQHLHECPMHLSQTLQKHPPENSSSPTLTIQLFNLHKTNDQFLILKTSKMRYKKTYH